MREVSYCTIGRIDVCFEARYLLDNFSERQEISTRLRIQLLAEPAYRLEEMSSHSLNGYPQFSCNH